MSLYIAVLKIDQTFAIDGVRVIMYIALFFAIFVLMSTRNLIILIENKNRKSNNKTLNYSIIVLKYLEKKYRLIECEKFTK